VDWNNFAHGIVSFSHLQRLGGGGGGLWVLHAGLKEVSGGTIPPEGPKKTTNRWARGFVHFCFLRWYGKMGALKKTGTRGEFLGPFDEVMEEFGCSFHFRRSPYGLLG